MHKTFMCFRVLPGYDGGCNFVAGKNLRIVCQVSDRSSGPVAVCFMVEPSGWYDCRHAGVVLRADTYVETGVDELPRQFGFAAEAVDYPALLGVEGFA